MNTKIIIKCHRVPAEPPPKVVRLTEEAGRVVRAIQRQTGLTARDVVSQIILQVADIIECEEEV